MNVILWGATGQAVVLRELFESSGDAVVALFDNDLRAKTPFAGVPLYYGPQGFEKWLLDSDPREVRGLAAIGGSRGADRLEVHALFKSRGIAIARAIHRSAFIASDCIIGEGAQVMAQATVMARAVVGDAVLINTAASVDHECILEDGVHIGPGATLSGCVHAGEGAFVGAGAVVLPRIHIGRKSIVGAGAVVTRDVPPGAVVFGNPAKLRSGARESAG